MMNDLPIDVLPDAETFYLTDVFPLYLLSINTMRAKGWGRQSRCLSPAWEMLPPCFFFCTLYCGQSSSARLDDCCLLFIVVCYVEL